MKKVITYGTFDLFHQGHYNIIKRAKELGDYLIVGVTSKSYDIDRGKLSVQDDIATRIENVRKTGLADEIIIEEYLGQKIDDIKNYNVDVLVVGSDWKGKFDHLKQYCEVVYLERTKNISSTQIREEMSSIYKVGIVTDNLDDNDVVKETKYVSGIHVESVFAEEKEIADDFCKKYELNSSFNDLNQFADSIGIAYVKTDINKRYDYIKSLIEKGKHVVCEFPFTLDLNKADELRELAKKNNVLLVENIVYIYLRAFTQILWMAQGNLIGNLLGVNISISDDLFEKETSYDKMSILSICAAIKILGIDFKKITCNKSDNKDENIIYSNINIGYDNKVANINIGLNVKLPGKLDIIGDKGTITILDDWWNTGYFKIKYYNAKHIERHSFNFEGNGFRYLLQEMLIVLKDKRTECNRLTHKDSNAIVEILKQI